MREIVDVSKYVQIHYSFVTPYQHSSAAFVRPVKLFLGGCEVRHVLL